MKFVLTLVLMASYALAELSPPQGNDPVGREIDNSDVILHMLQQIKGDVAQLSTKVDSLQATTDYLTAKTDSLKATSDSLLTTTDNLQATTDSLQTTVGILTRKVRTNEDDIADLKESDVETDVTSINALQQQITDLTNAVEVNMTALAEEDQNIKLEVNDLTLKEQSDYNQLDADISQLESNYDELRGDVSALNATCSCNQPAPPACQFSNGYNYTFVTTSLSRDEARSNCVNQGGDLAHHGFDSMTFREEVYCDHFNLCNTGVAEYPHIGLTKVSSSPVMWEYLDGTPSPEDDTWFPDQYDSVGYDCGKLYGYEGSVGFLRTFSSSCDWDSSSICEFAC